MATKKKKKRPRAKTYRFQLTLPGIAGIGIVCFCLFLWMFLLGIWAGQTFLLPSAKSGVYRNAGNVGDRDGAFETLVSKAKKKPTADAKR